MNAAEYDWRRDAACTSHHPELFFPIGTAGPARPNWSGHDRSAAAARYGSRAWNGRSMSAPTMASGVDSASRNGRASGAGGARAGTQERT